MAHRKLSTNVFFLFNDTFRLAWLLAIASADQRRVDRLDEGPPEQLVGATLILAGEEIDPRSDEFVQTQLTVVVGVDRLERRSGHLGVEADNVKKQLELVLLYHAVAVGVDCAEEEGEWTGEGLPQGGVLHLLLERGDERFLVQRLTSCTVLEVLLPDL